MGISREELVSVFEEIGAVEIKGILPGNVTGITQDSRLVETGFIFAARSGARSRGLDYIESAAEQGAVLVVTDEDIPPGSPLPVVRVGDFHSALVKLSHKIYGDPSRKVRIIALTGTNGKTSCAFLMKSILEAAGYKCGLMGTTGYFDGAEWLSATLTTPDIDRVCALLARTIRNRCDYVVMEVSSHALALGRVDGLKFAAGGFTNLTSEHLDFHETMEDYADTKALLFKQLPPEGIAVINIGDRWGKKMVDASRCRIVKYAGTGTWADVTVHNTGHTMKGGRFSIRYGGGAFDVRTRLVGDFQGENIALCATLGLTLGIPIEAIITGVSNLSLVEGRMEPVDRGQSFAVFVDYSHTPDSLENALKSARNLGGERLIVLFGCGGNRDRTKRPLMGAIAAELADRIIITSDNPRDESPGMIIEEILEGIPSHLLDKVESIIDRRKAIERAITSAYDNDILLLSGKGHETYQEINRVRRPFDDREVASELIEKVIGSKSVIKKKD